MPVQTAVSRALHLKGPVVTPSPTTADAALPTHAAIHGRCSQQSTHIPSDTRGMQ
jgi:hypothetical protein